MYNLQPEAAGQKCPGIKWITNSVFMWKQLHSDALSNTSEIHWVHEWWRIMKASLHDKEDL